MRLTASVTAIVLLGMLVNKLRSKTKSHIFLDRELRGRLKEHQIDKMVDDSYPASDPSSTY